MESTVQLYAIGSAVMVKSTGPAFRNVVQHMFRRYDDDDLVYCVWCYRVMVATRVQIESHFRSCDYDRSAAPCRNGDGSDRTFVCGVCDVTTSDSIQWTHHCGTADHWRRYTVSLRSNLYRPRYLYACGECDVTLYDEEDVIEEHVMSKHYDRGSYHIPDHDRFLAAVYTALALSRVNGGTTDAVHCCVGCQMADTRPVHAELRPECGGGGNAETFYCSACRVTIVCDALTYDQHRLSPEHMAMAERDNDDDDLCTVPRKVLWLVGGRGLRNRSRLDRDDDEYYSGPLWTCQLCGGRLPRTTDAVWLHVSQCPVLATPKPRRAWHSHSPPAGKSRADYDAFRCGVCRVTVTDAVAWKWHLSSVAAHAVTPHRMSARVYHECVLCRTLFYGPRDRLHDDEGPRCSADTMHRFRPLGPVVDLMHYVYRDTNSVAADDADYDYDCGDEAFYGSCSHYHYYYEQNTGRFGRCDRSAEPAAVPFYCPTCRLEFYGHRAGFRQHELTAEHVLIELFATVRPTTTATADDITLTSEYTSVEEQVAES